MKIFFDTEFIEDGRTIDLISIGMVSGAGDTLYLISEEADLARASEWVKENVLADMPQYDHRRQRFIVDDYVVSRKRMAELILRFVGEDKPEFWAYYADFDWVVLCQLFGTMMDLPKGWPMYCRDLKQLLDSRGNPRFQKDSTHNALGDAQWVASVYKELKSGDESDSFPEEWM